MIRHIRAINNQTQSRTWISFNWLILLAYVLQFNRYRQSDCILSTTFLTKSFFFSLTLITIDFRMTWIQIQKQKEKRIQDIENPESIILSVFCVICFSNELALHRNWFFAGSFFEKTMHKSGKWQRSYFNQNISKYIWCYHA